ncbi:MAG: GAF domain-containing protein [Betaproteobacteria bacterium]
MLQRNAAKAPIPESEAARLRALAEYEVLDTPPEAVFDDLTELAARICEAPIALISLIDESRQWFKSKLGLPVAETSRDVAFCAHAIRQNDLLIVPDATRDARFAGNPLVTEPPNIRFYAGAPLINPDGHALGTLCVIDRKPREMSADHQQALRVLSRHVMSQLELRRRTLEAARLRAERDEAMAAARLRHAEVERRVEERTTELAGSEAEARRQLEMAEKSRRALLSVLEDAQRAEQRVRASEEQLRDIIDGLGPEMLVGLLSTDGILIQANKSALAAANLRMDEVAGRRFEETYWWSYSESVQARLRAALAHAAEGKASRYDVKIRVADGALAWIDFSLHPLRDHTGRIAYLVPSAAVIDQRKRAEEALQAQSRHLQELTGRLVEVEEAERRAINRELHDRVGPSLAALSLNLNIIRGKLPEQVRLSVATRMDDVQSLIADATTQLRNVMADLRPPALDDYGLVAALRTYAEPFSARLGIPVSVEGEDIEPCLPLGTETALFRIAQEALNNVAKHAGARRVDVRIAAVPGCLILTVADDGAGFDVKDAGAPRSSWGLTTMRERAEAIGAALRIESERGRGTRVIVDMPRRTT